MERLRVFAGSSCPELAQRVCDSLGIKLSPIRIEQYMNGCFEVILGENVRNCYVFIIQTSLPDINLLHRHLLELMQMINAAYKSSAKEVTVVIPHFSYARSDRKWTGRMPIAGKLLVKFFEESGMTRMVGVEFHSPQFQSAFGTRMVVDHLETFPLFVRYLKDKKIEARKAIILPGDQGYYKEADRLGRALGIRVGSVQKVRLGAEKVEVSALHGRIKGKTVLIADDEILTAGTMAEVVRHAEKKKASSVTLLATHALFQGRAIENLNSPLIEEIVVCDTVPIPKEVQEKLPLKVLSIAPVLADAIREIYMGGSVSRLLRV